MAWFVFILQATLIASAAGYVLVCIAKSVIFQQNLASYISLPKNFESYIYKMKLSLLLL